MHIIIPDDYQNATPGLACFAKLAGHTVTVFNDTVKDMDALVERLYPAEALVLIRERTPITEALLARLPNLKLISQTGKGITHIDAAAATRHHVLICAGTGSPTAPAELTWALIMAALRHIPQEVAHLRAGGWQTTVGRVLRGRTLGIFGYGKIGSLVAGYGRAFGMKVLVWGREGSLARGRADGYTPAPDKETFFAQTDILSLHLRLIPETRGIVTSGDLALMKPDALLVNTSRAELIAPGALEMALRAGRPGWAAVDVYEEEPILGANHPLLKLDNALCTPHLGYVEQDSYELYFSQAFEQVLAFAEGHPINVVNPEILDT
ncbi:MAG: D-2-hydroxyacid dehydrogenase family protein [Chloroflexi bacterium]|nr:D-2-hydroxyacid dehydrogenase family protein [Chloroflexota bacterium]